MQEAEIGFVVSNCITITLSKSSLLALKDCNVFPEFKVSGEKQKKILLALENAGIFTSSGLVKDKEYFDQLLYDRNCSRIKVEQENDFGKVVPKEVVDSLMNGGLVLPYSTEFPLPSATSCPWGCKEAFYCRKLCAEADWKLSHSLLCTGERSKSLSREALSKFIQHANGTNDIFLLAAKAICFTISRYRKLKADYLKEQDKCSSANALDCYDLSLLLEAWKPISFGHKGRWWDCIALQDDVDSSDEASSRMKIRELANTSLQLLKAAIFDKECESLFSLEFDGHIIGMFELNNLDLVVASPVEDYFLYIDDLPELKKKEAEIIKRPSLDALGDDYSVCCEEMNILYDSMSAGEPLDHWCVHAKSLHPGNKIMSLPTKPIYTELKV
ncbi:hypothetical protein Dsin_031619 [Dipteronia sinensis]|uniref:MYND-type domain-containing protein n=1 Tax=Dipteronia sinensis TaxID=43782 RepID=A0AAD9ZM95_9ROSI|nr:hypothetical protein Dsin_031619 [Dipteronia sinensis]